MQRIHYWESCCTDSKTQQVGNIKLEFQTLDKREIWESCMKSCDTTFVSEGSLLELSNRCILRYLIPAFGLQIDLPQYLPHLTEDREIIL